MADNVNKQSVLIVDDDPSIRMLVSNTLRSQGFVPKMAADGKEGLEQAEKEHPDVILLDINMPEMDGFEVCTNLKKQNSTADIPVIFMTSLGNDNDRVKGFEIGGDDYLIKPVNYKELLLRIQRLLLVKKAKCLDVDTSALTDSLNTCTALMDELSGLDMPDNANKIVEKLLKQIRTIQQAINSSN